MLVKPNTLTEGFRMPGEQSMAKSSFALDVSDYHHSNVAWNKVKQWRRSKKRAINKSLNNARRLRSHSGGSLYGPIIADAYSELTLMRYSRIELALLSVCLVAMILCGIAAISIPIFFIATILSGWFATIFYRAYRHHMRCYWYVRMMEYQLCPHCGKSLGLIESGVNPRHAIHLINEVR
jgi:hypothetical protein